MKGETKVTQTGLKKGGKSCSFNVLLIIIFGLLFCPFCALATLIALRPFGESMYGKKVKRALFSDKSEGKHGWRESFRLDNLQGLETLFTKSFPLYLIQQNSDSDY